MSSLNNDLKDWDDRFYAPTKDRCDKCIPSLLAKEIKRMNDSFKGPRGPTGKCGPTYCVRCGEVR